MSDVEIPIHTQGYKSHKNSQLKLAIKQNGRLYFPGSSIKGAIKTAFFYNYLLANQDILRNWNLIIENYQNKRQYIEKWASEIEADFNQFFKNKKSEYNLFRVENLPWFKTNRWVIGDRVRFHLYNSNDETITWLTEAVCSNTEFEFGITFLPDFNVDYLQFLNDADITRVFSIINQFSNDQLENEIREIEASALSKDVKTTIINQLNELLKLAKEDRSALLRIGAGKSFFYNTVCLLLDNTHLEILRSVFNIGKTDDNIFPLTKTMTIDYNFFGWVLLKLPEVEKAEMPVNTVSALVENETELKAVIIEMTGK